MFLLKSFFTAIFSILALFSLTKLLGNKQISQLNMFDYVNGISIGSIAAELAVIDETENFLGVLIAMITYTLVGYLISLLTIKSIKLRRLLSGKSLLLIENGVIYKKNLIKARLDINDILTIARNQGYFNISEVECAIMENNGTISFMQKPELKAVNRNDMNILTQEDGLVYNVIIDGRVMLQNLRHSGNDMPWLEDEIKNQGYTDLKHIMLATIDINNNLSIYKCIEHLNKTNDFD